MVKVCFICNTPFIEKAAIQNLRDELDRLSEKETEIEFWFHGFHSYFNKAVLREVIQLKTDKPDQQLEIVDCCRRASLSENRRRCVSEAAEVIWRKQNRVKEWP